MRVVQNGVAQQYQTVAFDRNSAVVSLIDQRKLPHQFSIFESHSYQKTATAIREMVVRGAGAIGATAAFGYVQGLLAFCGKQMSAFERQEERVFSTLKNARPTAVDPVNAMMEIRAALREVRTIAGRQEAAIAAALRFAEANVQDCRRIGEAGRHLIQPGCRVLTHCNAGWLAFVDIGSATAPLYAAHESGVPFHVYCDETRPRCQGAALTAWELQQAGIAHQILADNAAGHLMSRGKVDLILVGSDRVVGKTGDIANKIGTFSLAVVARYHQVPFYVAIPLSTIDWTMETGSLIPIEERNAEEVTAARGVLPNGKPGVVQIANPGSPVLNPAFDVTPAELITGIITPSGIFRPEQLWDNRQRLGWSE